MTYFRPKWTCGRFNEQKRAAIMYNLIDGMSYFFEDDSAEVIGAVLAIERNVSFELEDISEETNTAIESLLPFFGELADCGLITTEKYDSAMEAAYREHTCTNKLSRIYSDHKAFLDSTTIDNASSAERLYSERVGGITSVMFELTYRCSAKCIHCYNPGAIRNDSEVCKRGDRHELQFYEYKRIIDELVSQGLIKVCLSGGDPFAKKEVWKLLEYLYNKDLAVDIFTNGIQICNNVNKIAAFYPRLIGVSLYSDIKEDHEAITKVRGSYEKTKCFIEECHKYGLPMNIKCCIMTPNVRSYYTVKKVAQQNCAIAQFDLNITDSVEGDTCASSKLRIANETLDIVLRDPDLPYYISAKHLEPNTAVQPNDIMCSAGFSSLCITPEGNIQPCCAYPMKLGNITNGTIMEVLENSRALKKIRSTKLRDCKSCFRMPYCVYCQMCPGNNYIENGTPIEPSKNNCELAIARYNLATKMKDGNYDPLNGLTLEERLSQVQVEKVLLERQYGENYRDIMMDK